MFTIVNKCSRQVQREAYRTAGHGGCTRQRPGLADNGFMFGDGRGRNIRDVRASVTRKRRADIRCRTANILDASAHPLDERVTGSVGSIGAAAGDTRQAVWVDFPLVGPRRAPLRESRLGWRYRRPGRCRKLAPLQPTQAPIDPNRDTAQDAINRGTTPRRRRQLHLSHAATGAVSQDDCYRIRLRSRGTPCTRNRIDFGKQDPGPKRGVNAGLVQKKQVRPGTRPGLTWGFRWS